MQTRHYSLVLLSLILSVNLFAIDKNTQLMHYRDVLYLGNLWSGSNNPVSMSYQPLDAVGNIAFDYQYEKGNLHKLDKAPKEHWWDVDIFGLKRFGKTTFEGKIAYQNGVENDRRWNSTLYISPLNPYILGDSIASRYNVEKFTLHGGFSYDLSSIVKLGLSATYEVGSSADQTDPRPETKGMRFSLNPGANFKLSENWSLGVSATAGWMREDISYSSQKTITYDLFIFKGFGDTHLYKGSSYDRRYRGDLYEGAIQLQWQKNGNGNFLELGINRKSEKTTDGGKKDNSPTFKGGDYSDMKIFLKERFCIRKERTNHNITVEGALNNVSGTWYNQKQQSIPGSTTGEYEWIIIDQSVNHKNTVMRGTLGYRMDLMKQNIPTLTWGINVTYNQTNMRQYPQEWTQKESSVYGVADVRKNFSIKKSLLSIGAEAGYYKSLSSSIDRMQDQLYISYVSPMLQYATADRVTAGMKISTHIALPFRKLTSNLGIYIKGGYEHYLGSENYFEDTNRFKVTTGVNFIF